jgi:antitoxin ParD1/3/4
MNVSLTPQLMELVQAKVASGMFNNASEVVREALRNLDVQKELLDELLLLKFGDALRPGLAEARQNEFLAQSFDDLIAEAEREDLAG